MGVSRHSSTSPTNSMEKVVERPRPRGRLKKVEEEKKREAASSLNASAPENTVQSAAKKSNQARVRLMKLLRHEMSLGRNVVPEREFADVAFFHSHLWSGRGIVELCILVSDEGLSATD